LACPEILPRRLRSFPLPSQGMDTPTIRIVRECCSAAPVWTSVTQNTSACIFILTALVYLTSLRRRSIESVRAARAASKSGRACPSDGLSASGPVADPLLPSRRGRHSLAQARHAVLRSAFRQDGVFLVPSDVPAQGWERGREIADQSLVG
jgi:hypothetical protein